MNSKTTRNILLALTLAFAIGPAQAAFDGSRSARSSGGSSGAYQAEVNRFIQMQNLRAILIKSLNTALAPLAAQGTISSSKLNALVEEIADFIYPKVQAASEQCLRQNFTIDELREVNAFYASPVGKKMNALTPTFMDVGSKTMQKADVQAQIQRIVQKHLGR